MTDDTQLVVDAIRSLKSEAHWVKEYLFPIAASFFSAAMGALFAFWSIKIQNRREVELERLHTANEWTLRVQNFLQSLVAIKSNYKAKLGDNPIQRALAIPMIVGDFEQQSLSTVELSFLVPGPKDTDGVTNGWRQLSRIRGMIDNCNLVHRIWAERNNLDLQIRAQLFAAGAPKGFMELTDEQVIAAIHGPSLAKYLDLTEKAIHLTDDMLIELAKFLEEFPALVKTLIRTSSLESYGRLIVFDIKKTPHLNEMIERCPDLDASVIADLYGRSNDEVRAMYDFGYPYERVLATIER